MNAAGQSNFAVRLRSRRVQRELDRLRGSEYERVLCKIKALAEDPRPRGCEKLEEAIYRIRVGDIRVIYLIDERKRRVEVGGIRRRSETTYKDIRALFS